MPKGNLGLLIPNLLQLLTVRFFSLAMLFNYSSRNFIYDTTIYYNGILYPQYLVSLLIIVFVNLDIVCYSTILYHGLQLNFCLYIRIYIHIYIYIYIFVYIIQI